MDASADVADAIGAMGLENGAKGKLPPIDNLEGHGEEQDALADGAHSGESEVINPSEEVEGEATSQSQDIKPRVSEVSVCHVYSFSLLMSSIDDLLTSLVFLHFHVLQGSQGHSPKVVKSQRQSPRSGDKSQTRKNSPSPYPKAPIARVSDPDLVDNSLSNGDASVSKKVSLFFILTYDMPTICFIVLICITAVILLVEMVMCIAV